MLLTPMDQETAEVPIEPKLIDKHDHFLNCVEQRLTPLTDIDDAIDTLKACLAFNRSVQSNAVEPV